MEVNKFSIDITHIPIKHLYLFIGIALITVALLVGIGCTFIGYYLGVQEVSVASQYGHDKALHEYPVIQYMQSGKAFCGSGGNIYETEFVPVKNRKGYFRIK